MSWCVCLIHHLVFDPNSESTFAPPFIWHSTIQTRWRLGAFVGQTNNIIRSHQFTHFLFTHFLFTTSASTFASSIWTQQHQRQSYWIPELFWTIIKFCFGFDSDFIPLVCVLFVVGLKKFIAPPTWAQLHDQHIDSGAQVKWVIYLIAIFIYFWCFMW